jgi:signal transduction histidine kinase
MMNNSTHNLYARPSIGNDLIKAKEVINHFINSCSHSMRGPLKSLTGLINILQIDISSKGQDSTALLNMMSESVFKLETLLVQFEQFLETSKQNLVMEPVNLDKLINDVVDDVERQTKFTGISVNTKIEQEDHLYADPTSLKLVLYNLINNAATFHDHNKREKEIHIIVKANKNSCSIQVNDNGIGIEEGIQANVFDLFFRGSDRSAGSGVGLYIVKEVLKKMGGSIAVNSQVSVGSNFFVWLPNPSH